MSATENLDRFSFTLPRELVDRLGEVAEGRDRSKSGMLRQVLTRILPEFESAGVALHAPVEGGGPDKTPLRPADVGPLYAQATSAVPLPNVAALPSTAASAPASATGCVEAGARLHVAALQRQADAKAAQAAEHAQRRQEAVENTLSALKRIGQ